VVKQGNDNHVKLINKAATQIHLGELCGLSIRTEMSFKWHCTQCGVPSRWVLLWVDFSL